ncbi:hypothetical protein UE98_39565, partial [Burkholderia cenocepacia]
MAPTEFGNNMVAIAMQVLGVVIDIDAATLVENNRQGIGRAGDHGRGRRRDHPLGKDRAWLRGIGLEVIVLDRGDQPTIGIVEKRLDVGAAVRFAHLAGLFILGQRDRREIDRAK